MLGKYPSGSRNENCPLKNKLNLKYFAKVKQNNAKKRLEKSNGE